MEVFIWLIVMVLLLGVEAASVVLVSIWFAGGALVALLVAALGAPVWLQIIVFLLVALVLLVFTRPIAMKYFNTNRIKTNVESLIGKQAIVVSEIDNLRGIGQATVGHQQWSAKSTDDTVVIPEGAVVEIVDIKGVKLIVRDASPVAQKPAKSETKTEE